MAGANSQQMKAEGKKLSLSGPSAYLHFLFTLLILLPLLILLIPFAILSILVIIVRNKLFSKPKIEKISSLSSKSEIISKDTPRAYDLVSPSKTLLCSCFHRFSLVPQDLLDSLLPHI
jgi:hypothetical protein